MNSKNYLIATAIAVSIFTGASFAILKWSPSPKLVIFVGIFSHLGVLANYFMDKEQYDKDLGIEVVTDLQIGD